MKTPSVAFLILWSFWWLGCSIYTWALATGTEWAIPIGGFAWLAGFAWFEAIPLKMRKPGWTLSGVVGFLIWRPSKGKDPAWGWLADAIALPVAVLLTYTLVRLFPGWTGWTLGLGYGALLLVILHGHFRLMSKP